MDIPVFLTTGFLESGKTSFVQETLYNPEFAQKERMLLIVCEEGMVEYEDYDLEKMKISMVTIEEEEELTSEFLEECASKYRPQKVMVEYNGTWDPKKFTELKFPKDWFLAQVITTVDQTTYQAYLGNMRQIMINNMAESDLVIFNRCEEDTDKTSLRRSVKLANRKAQIVYELKDGTVSQGGDDELPYNLDDEVIDICDDDYGLFYIDAMDNPKRYEGKTVKFLATVFKSPKFRPNEFVPGRFAMTCCADDIAFIGFVAKSDEASGLENKEWVVVTAKIKVEFRKDYRGKGPVLYPVSIEKAEKPEDDLIYMN